jgi:hypothetical protein
LLHHFFIKLHSAMPFYTPFTHPWPYNPQTAIMQATGQARDEEVHRNLAAEGWNDEADAWQLLKAVDTNKLYVTVVVPQKFRMLTRDLSNVMPQAPTFLGEFLFRRATLTHPWELIRSR